MCLEVWTVGKTKSSWPYIKKWNRLEPGRLSRASTMECWIPRIENALGLLVFGQNMAHRCSRYDGS